MVSDTRSARKSKYEAEGHSSKKRANTRKDGADDHSSKKKENVRKEESDGHSSKKKVNIRKDESDKSMRSPGKADVSSVRRSARETSLSRQTMPSPQSTRKSKRLEKGMPSLTPPVKRKSERLEQYTTPSPLRRSDRGKKNLSPGSSGFKKSAKELSLLESKRKKEKTLIQVTMESEKAELDLEAVGMKRKKMNARAFKALFKRQRIKEIVADGDRELEAPDKSSNICNENSKDIVSVPIGNGEDASDDCSRRMVGKSRDESNDKASNGAIQKSICSLKGCHENDINVDSRLRDNDVDVPCAEYTQTSSSVRETFDYSQRLRTNCSSPENMDAPESESSTCLARSQDGSASSESSEKYKHQKEATPSPSPKCGNCNLLGTCVLCSKNKRVGYDSPEQELCSCSPMVAKDLVSFSTSKDRSDHGAAITSESAGKCDCRNLLTDTHADSQMDFHENVCALCNKDGELLYCAGNGCKRCYHLCCLDPPLTDALPGVWHCPQCVKKKLLFGVHSVSDGFESIWDVREVEVSNAEGVRQRQYLVKYYGLAHVHNHWVPEKQLLLENPSLVSNFIERKQNVRWNAEWTVPHRLLRKRYIQEKIYIASSAVISVCNNEWLVKWHGFGYDHATWELDNAYFLSSSQGQNLMKDYEIRRQKGKQEVSKYHKGSSVKLLELPASQSHVNSTHVLKNVNKLRECLFQCQNAVVFDDQERATTVIFFIQSMSEICRPFLIVTASSSLSQWEAEFARLVPSVDVVVYSGNIDTRKRIRASEFYEGGHVMLQVLLTSAEAVIEDLDIFRSIKWEAIVIDEYQHYEISNDLGQIKMLTAESRILLVNGQIKDTTSEYLKILSLLESDGDFDKLSGLKSETNDNLCKLKDRLSRFIAYGSTSQVSKFLEYWVPVEISNYQLEQYCATLLSNSIPLRSCSRNDRVGAFRDILLTVRKCCDHPYLLDSSVQERLIAEQRPAAELLDIGIKACGKLQVLDSMLAEIKARGLQVLVLFQLINGSGGASNGDILDDFLRQRFGQNTYERIDSGVIPSKKQAVVNRFNKKETGQFVFLLENRACSSIIKLSSLDIIVIYDSDWNPANDLRTLQKISIDSKVEQIKVFRLYSSYTVEERALILAKQNLNLDNNLQTFSRTTSDTLLSWGATYLFSKLDEYHADSNSTLGLNFSSGQVLLNEVTEEFRAILSGSCKTESNSVISKVKLGVGSYNTNAPMLGEAKVHLKDGEEPHVFWRNLLDGKNPQWKHLRAPSPRNRKRVHYLDVSPSKSVTEKDDVVKKRKKMVNENLDPALVQVELGGHQLTQVAASKGGRPSTIKACNQSQDLQKEDIISNNNPNILSGQSSSCDEVSAGVSEERIYEQKSHHTSLQGEITRLCQILKLSDDVTHVARTFLEYIIKNHHVNSDSPPIVQAFQISLCWIAASITKQKVDKKDSLMLAKQLLNYQCTEEQASSVYSKMRSLKRMYLQCSENTIGSGRVSILAEEDISKEPSNVQEGGLQFLSYKQKNAKMENGEKSADEEQAEAILLQQKLELNERTAASEVDSKLKKIQKKCEKRMKKLIQKHQEEIQEFHRIWEEKRKKLETDHKLESAFIRSIHGQGSVRMDKLKLLDDNFAKKMEEHNLLKDVKLKDLAAKQLAAINEERQKAAHWLAKAKACSGELRPVNGPRSLGSQSESDVGGPQPSTPINTIGPEDATPLSRQHAEVQHPSKSFCTRGDDFTHSVTSISGPAETIGSETPAENLVTVDSQNEAGIMSLERSSLSEVEHLTLSKQSNDNGKTVSGNLPAPVEQVSDEILSVDPTEELPIEVLKTVPNEVMGDPNPVELSVSSNESGKASKIALLDDLLSQRDGPDKAASRVLQSPGRSLVHLKQTIAMPDCCEVLPQQVQDKMDESLVSAELQVMDASDVENQSTLPIEVATSELIDTVTTVPSNLEAPATDEIVTTGPSNQEAPVTENSEQLHIVSADVSLSCNESLAIEDHDQGRSSSQTAAPGRMEVLSHESTQNGENLNDAVIPQEVVSTAERPNQAVLPLEIDGGHLHGSSFLLVHPTHQPTSWNSAPSLIADPLQNELERIHKETGQLEKNHEDMMAQLKSDCEKEIQEIITQIRNKYEVKLQETEAEFRLKRNEFDKNQNKVLMNKILAEAFRSKCLDLRPSGLPIMQQGAPSSFMQHLHQLSSLPSVRPSPGASACQPAPSQPITTPAVQTMPQLSRPYSGASASQPAPSQHITTPTITPTIQTMPQLSLPLSLGSSPVASHNVTAPAVKHGAALFSGTSSRPPLISAITPAGNPRVGGEIRSPAPHLQSFRPAVAASNPPTTTSPSVSHLRPLQMLPSQPVQLTPPPASRSPLPNLVSQNRPEPQGGPAAPPNASLSALGLDQRPTSVPENRTSSPLPEICSTFRSLEIADLEILGNTQGSQTSAAATNVVCLSDDD